MSELIPAATVILARPAATASGFEIVWLQRNPQLRYLGGFWVFPGGRVEQDEGLEEAALRETFEETGILLVEGAADLPAAQRRAAREELLERNTRLDALVASLGLELNLVDLLPCGRFLTPPFGPTRFDTRFFLARVPAGAELSVLPGEMDQGEWIDPQSALGRWRVDEALLAPPTRITLEALAEAGGSPDEPGWLERTAAHVAGRHPPDGKFRGGIDFWPGIRMVLLRTPTLPPATHTNCLIVGDGSELVVIDPASPWEEEQAYLDGILDALAADGQQVREILLTHHHPDHASGAQHLADRLGVPIAAHARTRELLAGRGVTVTRDLEDGERIELPADRPGARPRSLKVHLTEGHADGHLVFLEESTGALHAGDMVAGIGTILIDPPEGKMGLYIESLRSLERLAATLIYPSHGPVIGDPALCLAFYIEHRLEREGKVLAALEGGPDTIPGLIPRAYDDKPPEVWPLATRAALAHLQKLEADGKVRQVDDDRWALT